MTTKAESGFYSAVYHIPCFSEPYAGFRAGRSARAAGPAHGTLPRFLRFVSSVFDSIFAVVRRRFWGMLRAGVAAWRTSECILARNLWGFKGFLGS